MAQVLIAGAGDLGVRIAQVCQQDGHSVSMVARRPRDTFDWAYESLDLRERVPEAPCEVLIHCLAPAQRDEAGYRDTYVRTLERLLAGPARRARVLFVSSTAVYGDQHGGWVDEETPCNPESFNGLVLLEAERLLAAHGTPGLSLRLGGIYGPGRERLLRLVEAGTPIANSGSPQYGNRIHVEDAARAAAFLAGSSLSGVVNVVDDAPADQSVVLDWLADAMQRPRLPRSSTSTASVGPNRRVSNQRLRRAGFVLHFPDYRAGYAAILADTWRA